MKYFYAIVHKDDDSAFGVEFPDLPGCFSAADTEDEIIPNASEALDLWFDDQPDIVPSPLAKVRDASDEALRAGAFIVAVPRITRGGKQERVNLSLDRGILDAIDTAAAERKLTRSAFLAQAARNEIEGRR